MATTRQCRSWRGERPTPEAELKDVGDQALMRGLDTAFPIMRPGLSLSYCGRRSVPATKRLTDIPLPLSRLRPCARCKFVAVIYVLIACASLATAHMKPASSRAIAVQTTVVRFPRTASKRYRAVNLLWAFHAISPTAGGVACRWCSFLTPSFGGCIREALRWAGRSSPRHFHPRGMLPYVLKCRTNRALSCHEAKGRFRLGAK